VTPARLRREARPRLRRSVARPLWAETRPLGPCDRRRFRARGPHRRRPSEAEVDARDRAVPGRPQGRHLPGGVAPGSAGPGHGHCEARQPTLGRATSAASAFAPPTGLPRAQHGAVGGGPRSTRVSCASAELIDGGQCGLFEEKLRKTAGSTADGLLGLDAPSTMRPNRRWACGVRCTRTQAVGVPPWRSRAEFETVSKLVVIAPAETGTGRPRPGRGRCRRT
jgi:hypothetical protein